MAQAEYDAEFDQYLQEGDIDSARAMIDDGRINIETVTVDEVQFALDENPYVADFLLSYPAMRLKYYAMEGDLKEVREAIERHGINPAIDDNFAIQFAASNGHVDVVRYLLRDPRTDPTPGNGWALVSAAHPSAPEDEGQISQERLNNSVQVVRMLLQWRGPNGEFVNPAANDRTLVWPCQKGYYEIVKLLLEWRGPNGEFVNPDVPFVRPGAQGHRSYPIVEACWNNHVDVVSYLLDWRGPNDEIVNLDGHLQCLTRASNRMLIGMLKTLIRGCSDRNIPPARIMNILSSSNKRYMLSDYDIVKLSKTIDGINKFGLDLNKASDREFIDILKAKYAVNKQKYSALMKLLNPGKELYEGIKNVGGENFEMKGLASIIGEYAFEDEFSDTEKTKIEEASALMQMLYELGIDEVGIMSMIGEYLE